MRYLFFDCEGANCFNGVNKMSSFGYVLTNTKFEIIQKRDIVMNPEAPFDPYFFKKKSEIKLGYEVEYFKQQENFRYHHDRIKFLLEQKDLLIFGHSISNDIKYIHDACQRYNLPMIVFEGYDSQVLFSILKNNKKQVNLEQALKTFNVDVSQRVTHRSDEDAYITMQLVQSMCKVMEMDVNQLIEIDELEPPSLIRSE